MVREEAPAEPFEIVGVMRRRVLFPARREGPGHPQRSRLARIARHQGGPVEPLFERLGVFYGLARLKADATAGMVRAEAALYIKSLAEKFKVDLSDRADRTDADSRSHLRPCPTGAAGAHGAPWCWCCSLPVSTWRCCCSRAAPRGRASWPSVRRWAPAAAGLMRQLLAESALIALAGTVGGRGGCGACARYARRAESRRHSTSGRHCARRPRARIRRRDRRRDDSRGGPRARGPSQPAVSRGRRQGGRDGCGVSAGPCPDAPGADRSTSRGDAGAARRGWPLHAELCEIGPARSRLRSGQCPDVSASAVSTRRGIPPVRRDTTRSSSCCRGSDVCPT